MIKNFSRQEYAKAKSYTRLCLTCEHCRRRFLRSKKEISKAIRTDLNRGSFCSLSCVYKSASKRRRFRCSHCSKEIWKLPCEIRKSKSGRHFCSKSCSATYNNINKTTGSRRSKLEKWIEKKLKKIKPGLEILFNDKNTIGSEVDIYIPSLKLAIEINGIYHYCPIHGEKKLKQIQENDIGKKKSCREKSIRIICIDVSKMNNFSEKNGQPYLDRVVSLINESQA